jgi:PAS domain S-box-containing protein
MTDEPGGELAIEGRRLAALYEYQILDTPAEGAFDDLAWLAARACAAPVALVTFVDRRRVWVKAAVGWTLREMPRAGTVCEWAVAGTGLLMVEDLAAGSRFASCPTSALAEGFRFYAGMPLRSADGLMLGTLCVLDREVRGLTAEQCEALQILARQVETQLELRRNLRRLERSLKDHERAEAALSEAEEKYRSIFENVVEGIFLTTPEGRYLSANPMLARIYGYSSAEELMAAVQDISHQVYVDPGRREDFLCAMRERGEVSRFESQVRRKDGSVIWISENARAVRDTAGRLRYFEGTVEDITERKRAEEAMRDTAVLYHSLVDCLPQNIFRKDREGRFTFVNPRFCQTLGRPPEEIRGRTDFDFFPAELAAKYREDDREVMERQIVLDKVEAHVKPDGGMLYVQVLKTPLFDAAGQIIGVQGIFWDVTERRRMEEAIAHERDLLQALLDSIPDAIYFKDAESRFLRCSRAMAAKFGLDDPRDLLGKRDADFFGQAHAAQAYADEQRILQTGEPVVGLKELETYPDGRCSWALTTKMPLRDGTGRIIGTFGVSKDITTLVAAEQQLAQARDAAIESMRLKGEFLANMSHELRTPMHAIIGMSGCLLETELTPDQRDAAETVRRSAEALLGIINDILDLSRLEARGLKLDAVDFDLRDLVETTTELLAESAHSKGLELVVDLPEALPRFWRGDPARLRQVLTNLVGNAIKFTARGWVEVRATVQPEAAGAGRLACTIRDTGIGIAPEALGRIFEPFQQADGSTTRKYGGTGLGLAISRQIAELMGGDIAVTSEPGQGSTFLFTACLGAPAAARTEGTGAGAGALVGRRVLVVDDQELSRAVLVRQFVAWGMQVTAAGGGANALARLQMAARSGAPCELAVVDMQMPEVDGLTLAEAVRAEPELAATRLVMLTSLSDRLDMTTMRNAGVSACLIKPPRQARLYDAMVKVATASTPAGVHGVTGLAAVRKTEPPPTPAASGAGLRVLLAEDNLVNQRLALRQLRRLGYAADAVANGVQVLEAIRRQRYDILLLDCQMPELDGYSTARQLRKQEVPMAGRSTLHIVAMTANAMTEDRERCLAAGMDDYISKPVRLPDLDAALHRAVRKLARSESEPPAPPRAASEADDDSEEARTLDRTMLRSLAELNVPGETDAVVEMVGLFLKNAVPLRDRMATAAAAGDLAEFQAAAHSLKGSAGGLGARRLSRLCAELEKRAKAGDLPGVRAAVAEVGVEFGRVEAALAEEMKGPGGGGAEPLAFDREEQSG